MIKDAEPKRAKPTPAQIHDTMLTSLKAMVAEADADGRRDRPAVVAAREAIALCEDEPKAEAPEARASTTRHK